MNDQHFEAIEDLKRIGSVDLANQASLIDPSISRRCAGIPEEPTQLAIFRLIRRKLQVHGEGVLIHLTVQAQQLHREDSVRDLPAQELDRVLWHSLPGKAEVSCRSEGHSPSREIRGEKQERENCEKDRCEIHFSSIAKGYTNQAETLQHFLTPAQVRDEARL